MLYYIKCTNFEGYESYYTGNGDANPDTWKHILYIIPPTLMHIFKAKQLINNMKALDSKIDKEKGYTYTIIPALSYTIKE